MGLFGAADGWGSSKRPRSLKSFSFTLPTENSKKYLNHVTHPLSSADISIFSPEIANFAISRNTDTDFILVHYF